MKVLQKRLRSLKQSNTLNRLIQQLVSSTLHMISSPKSMERKQSSEIILDSSAVSHLCTQIPPTLTILQDFLLSLMKPMTLMTWEVGFVWTQQRQLTSMSTGMRGAWSAPSLLLIQKSVLTPQRSSFANRLRQSMNIFQT